MPKSLVVNKSNKPSRHAKQQAKKRGSLIRKFTTTFIAVVAAVSLLAVGVVAVVNSFSAGFSNSISINIDKVEGTLYGSRVGGVLSGSKVDAPSITNDVLYTTEGNTTDALEALEGEKVNFSPDHSKVQYIFKFVVDDNAGANTKIDLTYTAITTTGVSATYAYCFNANDGMIVWSGTGKSKGVKEFSNGSHIVVGTTNKIVYVLCEIELDTSKDVSINKLAWEYNLKFTGTTEAETVVEDTTQDVTIEKDGLYRITFGNYPQSVASDQELLESSFSANKNLTKLENGYTINGTKYDAYTYIDGESYVRVPVSALSYAAGVTAPTGTYVWFKIEPIVWKILNGTASNIAQILNGQIQAEVVSEKVLMGLEFNSSLSAGNLWKNSNVRTYLNETFYNEAFSSEEKSRIFDNTILNNASGQQPNGTTQVSGGAALTTTDKVWMLSFYDYTKLLANKSEGVGVASSMALGCGISATSSVTPYMLRDASEDGTILTMLGTGEAGYAYVNKKTGVRPAICFSAKDLNIEDAGSTKYTIEFGEYPQTYVTDATLVASLNALSTSARVNSFTIGENTFYVYLLNGTKYAKVYSANASFAGTNTMFSGGVTISSGSLPEVMWFKVEPIKWIIANATEKNIEKIRSGEINAVLLADQVLFSGLAFGGSPTTWQNSNAQTALNGQNNTDIFNTNYANNSFFENAFNANEKKIILNHTNEDSSTGLISYDRVWLLSSTELNNYFGTAGKLNQVEATATDFALANGQHTRGLFGYGVPASWWLADRSQDDGDRYQRHVLDLDVVADNLSEMVKGAECSITYNGYRPAIALNLVDALACASTSESEDYERTNTFWINYYLNNGSSLTPYVSSQIISRATLVGNSVVEPSVPTRSGYTFAGWYDNAEGYGDQFDFSAAVTKDYNLYAKWIKNGDAPDVNIYVNVLDETTGNYKRLKTVTAKQGQSLYNSMFGEAETVVIGDKTYVFTGWLKDSYRSYRVEKVWRSSSSGYLVSTWWEYIYYLTNGVSSSTASEGLNVYAMYDVAQKVNFYDDILPAGKLIETKMHVTARFPATANSEPPIANFTDFGVVADKSSSVHFTGWMLDGDTTTVWAKDGAVSGLNLSANSNYKATDTTNFYARWGNDLTLTLDLKDGTTPSTLTIVQYTKYTMVPTSTAFGSNYEFVNWYLDGDYASVYGGTPITENTTLYAKWIRIYNVSLYLQAGDANPYATYKVKAGGSVGRLPSPTKSGYTFKGWATEDSYDHIIKIYLYSYTTINEDCKYIAVYTKDDAYNVVFDANGGTIAGKSSLTEKVEYGSSVTEAPTPVREGYTFVGWATANSRPNTVDPTTITVTSNTAYYAVWSRTYESIKMDGVIYNLYYKSYASNQYATAVGVDSASMWEKTVNIAAFIKYDGVTYIVNAVNLASESAHGEVTKLILGYNIGSITGNLDTIFPSAMMFIQHQVTNSTIREVITTAVGSRDYIKFKLDSTNSETTSLSVNANGVRSVVVTGGKITGALDSTKLPMTLSSFPIVAIGNSAFAGQTSITSISFTSNVVTIGAGAFNGCNLSEIIIPGAEVIGEKAFYGNAAVSSIAFGSALKSIGKSAFEGCTSLQNITFNSAVNIGERAFASTDVKRVSLSGGTIGSEAFYNLASLYEVILGDGVTSVGKSAFADCVSLKNVTLPAENCTIGDLVFDGTYGLAEVVQGTSTSTSKPIIIGSWAFGGTGIKGADLVVSLKNAILSGSAFYGNRNLKSLLLENGEIGSQAFENCSNLTSVTLKNVATIGSRAFAGCGLTGALDLSSISNIKIGEEAFLNNYNITSINLPTTFGSFIGARAFLGLRELTVITIGGGTDVTTTGDYVYKVDKGVLYEYSTGAGYTLLRFPSKINIVDYSVISGTVTIEKNAFGKYVGGNIISLQDGEELNNILISIFVPNTVTNMSTSTFDPCIALTTRTYEEGSIFVDSEDNFAVYNSDKTILLRVSQTSNKVKTFVIPDTVVAINENAINNPYLEKIVLGANVKTILPGNFIRCSSLSSITVSSANSNFGEVSGALYALENGSPVSLIRYPLAAPMVSTLTVPSTVTTISDNAFYGNSNVLKLSLPQGLTTIGANAFYDTSLSSIDLSKAGAISVGENAFYSGMAKPISVICSSANFEAVRASSSSAIAFENAFSGILSKLGSLQITGSATIKYYILSTDSQYALAKTQILVNTYDGLDPLSADCRLVLFGGASNYSEVVELTFASNYPVKGYNYTLTKNGVADAKVTKSDLNEKSYTITLNDLGSIASGNKGSYSLSFETTVCNKKVTVTIHVDGTVKTVELVAGENLSGVADPTVSGKNFVGYTTTEGGSTMFGKTTAIYDDLELWAKFENAIFNIFYKETTGNDVDSVLLPSGTKTTFVSGETITLPVLSEKVVDGKLYKFDGWYANSDLTGSALTQISGATSDQTVYAKWTLTYVVEGGIVYSLDKTKIVGLRGFTADSLTVISSVTEIAENAFAGNTTILTFDIPATVTKIGASAFAGINNDATIYFEGTESIWTAIGGESANTNNITVIFYEATETVDGIVYAKNRTKIVGLNGFTGTSLVVLASVTEIAENAFAGNTTILTFDIPSTVTTIGANAFKGVNANVNIFFQGDASSWAAVGGTAANPDGLPVVFYEVEATETVDGIVYASDRTIILGLDGYTKDSLVVITSVTEIAENAFAGNTTILTFDIPSTVTTIGENAFKSVNSSAQILFEGDEAAWTAIGGTAANPDGLPVVCYGVTYEEDGIVYENSSKTKIVGLAEGFSGTKIVVPGTVTEIGAYAFENATTLVEIEITNSVTKIGEGAFAGLTDTQITFVGTEAEWSQIGGDAANVNNLTVLFAQIG